MAVHNITRLPLRGFPATAASMNASFNGAPYLLERMGGFSICAAITETLASLAGTLKLQASNNAFLDNTNGDANSAATWVDIPSSSVTLTAGNTTVLWNVTDVHYEAVRVVWTRSTGQGTFLPFFLAKG